MNIILTITLLQKTNLSIARKSMRLIAFEFHINFIWPRQLYGSLAEVILKQLKFKKENIYINLIKALDSSYPGTFTT